MNKFLVLFKYEFFSILTGKWLWTFLALYNLLFALVSYYSTEAQQFYISAANLLVYFNFTALILFSNLYWQNNTDFVSLILTQPVNRSTVFLSRLTAFYCVLFITTTISLVFHLSRFVQFDQIFILSFFQIVAQAIAIGIGFSLSVSVSDRLKSLAVGMGLIVLFIFVMDAISLWTIINYSQYPLEKVLLIISALNPIGLVKFEALRGINMTLWSGYAGMLLKRVFDSKLIVTLNLLALFIWWLAPTYWSMRLFKKKDM